MSKRARFSLFDDVFRGSGNVFDLSIFRRLTVLARKLKMVYAHC